MPELIEMDSDGAEAFLGRLAGAAADLRSAWAADAQRIAAGEAGIGSDRLAAAFNGPYQNAADLARVSAERVSAAQALVAAYRQRREHRDQRDRPADREQHAVLGRP